ncbi:MAG: YkgJ family cysteine cluster protein [Chlamydiota bacterium]|nr:YkgJ family cysteine cluster protein [Chlamydiota bacterium]
MNNKNHHVITIKSQQTFDFLKYCRTCIDPCCHGYFICSETEYQRIRDYSGKDYGVKKDGYYEFSGEPCPYLKENGLCSIHPVRPRICQIYPYYPDVDDEIQRITLKRDNACPANTAIDQAFMDKALKIADELIQEIGEQTYIRFWYD